MHPGVLVTFARVTPIDDIDSSVGSRLNVDPAIPLVSHQENIGFVSADKSTPFSIETLHVGSTTMHIDREKPIVIGLRPGSALVDHHADMGMASAELVGSASP